MCDAALAALDAFEHGPWGVQGVRFPTVVAAGRRAWIHVMPFFACPPEVRRVLDTTTVLESVNARVRKIIKTRGQFPTDEAATTLIWLALRTIAANWSRPPAAWRPARTSWNLVTEPR